MRTDEDYDDQFVDFELIEDWVELDCETGQIVD